MGRKGWSGGHLPAPSGGAAQQSSHLEANLSDSTAWRLAAAASSGPTSTAGVASSRAVISRLPPSMAATAARETAFHTPAWMVGCGCANQRCWGGEAPAAKLGRHAGGGCGHHPPLGSPIEAGEVQAAMKQLQAALRPIFREEVRFAVRASSLKLPLGQTLSWRAAARSVAPHARAPLLCMHCPLTTLACACLISTHSHRRHRTSTIPMRTWLPTRCRLTMDLTWAGCNASSGVLTRMNISTPTRWPSRRGAQSRAIGCICKGHFHDVNKLVSRDGNSMSRCGMHGCCQTLLQGRATRYNGGRHSAPCDPPPKNS